MEKEDQNKEEQDKINENEQVQIQNVKQLDVKNDLQVQILNNKEELNIQNKNDEVSSSQKEKTESQLQLENDENQKECNDSENQILQNLKLPSIKVYRSESENAKNQLQENDEIDTKLSKQHKSENQIRSQHSMLNLRTQNSQIQDDELQRNSYFRGVDSKLYDIKSDQLKESVSPKQGENMCYQIQEEIEEECHQNNLKENEKNQEIREKQNEFEQKQDGNNNQDQNQNQIQNSSVQNQLILNNKIQEQKYEQVELRQWADLQLQFVEEYNFFYSVQKPNILALLIRKFNQQIVVENERLVKTLMNSFFDNIIDNEPWEKEITQFLCEIIEIEIERAKKPSDIVFEGHSYALRFLIEYCKRPEFQKYTKSIFKSTLWSLTKLDREIQMDPQKIFEYAQERRKKLQKEKMQQNLSQKQESGQSSRQSMSSRSSMAQMQQNQKQQQLQLQYKQQQTNKMDKKSQLSRQSTINSSAYNEFFAHSQQKQEEKLVDLYESYLKKFDSFQQDQSNNLNYLKYYTPQKSQNQSQNSRQSQNQNLNQIRKNSSSNFQPQQNSQLQQQKQQEVSDALANQLKMEESQKDASFLASSTAFVKKLLLPKQKESSQSMDTESYFQIHDEIQKQQKDQQNQEFQAQNQNQNSSNNLLKEPFTNDNNQENTDNFDSNNPNAKYLKDPYVVDKIKYNVQKIKDLANTILESIFTNLNSLPIGIRIVCKIIEILAKQKFPQIKEKEVHKIMGNFLFQIYLIPQFQFPQHYRVLELIKNSHQLNLNELKKVLNKIYMCEEFENPHSMYAKFNPLIRKIQKSMHNYYQELLNINQKTIEELIYKTKQQQIFLAEEKQDSNQNQNQNQENLKNQQQQQTQQQKQKQQQNENPDNKNQQEKLRVFCACLSVENINTLCKMIKACQNEIEAVDKSIISKLKKILVFAEDDKCFLPNSNLVQGKTLKPESIFVLFMETKFSKNLESDFLDIYKESYKINKNMEPKTRPYYQDSILPGVKIDQIPLNLKIQFLQNLIEQLPKEYQENNMAKLYYEMKQEQEQRLKNFNKICGQTKAEVLVAKKNLTKFQEIMLEMIEKCSKEKKRRIIYQFVQNEKLNMCVTSPKTREYLSKSINFNKYVEEMEENVNEIWIQEIDKCVHTKCEGNLEFIKSLSGINTSQQQKQISKLPHSQDIQELILNFCNLPEVKNSIQEDYKDLVNPAFNVLLQLLEDKLKKNKEFINIEQNQPTIYKNKQNKQNQITWILEALEKYITKKIYDQIFPQKKTYKDTALYQIFRVLNWINYEHLGIDPINRVDNMWEIASQELLQVDSKKTPAEKLQCFLEAMTIMNSVQKLTSIKQEAKGADDALPILIYIVLKAQLSRLYSNLKFIDNFQKTERQRQEMGYSQIQMQIAVQFFENLGFKDLKNIKELQFYNNFKANTYIQQPSVNNQSLDELADSDLQQIEQDIKYFKKLNNNQIQSDPNNSETFNNINSIEEEQIIEQNNIQQGQIYDSKQMEQEQQNFQSFNASKEKLEPYDLQLSINIEYKKGDEPKGSQNNIQNK
ncbi:Rho GTPase activation protein [Pseudocohnilembus persalinus]|uniref:Rho GTPase activation protein n=1 Tax=Pseudocohnilembus persalinus TaxID=266149 RepID=A0A0V0QGN0_PSEPJ|nr:Rho GTPase activation protein [Pseudocohnilembus persalinus]|eukprot:KRX01389.1 Rho GTPase activation protein [Pseudocohnilembus persalinus]